MPPYSARAQVTRSSAVEAIEPALPAAVTTEVNGTTSVPSVSGIGFSLDVRSVEPVGPRERAARRVDALVVGVVEPERGQEPRVQLLGQRRLLDRLGEQAEDQVVRVRVVPALAGLEVRLADVGERLLGGPDPRRGPTSSASSMSGS